MKQNMILLSGKKQSGKDTFAKFFCNDGYIKFAFADELKFQLRRFLIFVLGVDTSKVDFENNKETGLGLYLQDGKEITNRMAMQMYGQEMKKIAGLNYWVKALTKIIKLESKNNIVITDCRFKYELGGMYDAFEDKYNIYSVRINRTNKFGEEDKDISETDLDSYDGFDFYVQNDGTLEDLEQEYKRIKKIIE